MKKIAIAACILLASCTNGDKAKDVLLKNGYTEISITGYRPFQCSEDDEFKTGFRAKAPNGEYVEGTVCGGWFKGNTIRLD